MKTLTLEIKWAIIFVIMMLLWMVMERLAGLHDEHIDQHDIYTNVIAIPAVAVYVIALLDKRKNYYHGIMTYKQGFMTGLWITIFITIISPLTQYITSVIISPQYFPNMMKYTVAEGKMTQQAAEDYFNLKNFILQGLIGAFVMGLMTTAIVALFTRRKSSSDF